MPVVNLGSFAATFVAPLTSEPTDWSNSGSETAVVVYASQPACLRIGQDATLDDFLLTGGSYAKVRIDVGEVLSFVAAAGASAGEVRITLAGES
jgi:hypothetical protein